MRSIFAVGVLAFLCACPGQPGVKGNGDTGRVVADAGDKVPVCGDAVLDTGEACDDGNASDTDSCLSDCTLASCGDGFARGDLVVGDPGFEACDDANDEDTDACRNNCLAAACGDGVLRLDLLDGALGYEACDDGNSADDDACTSACVDAVCGDGIARSDLAAGDLGYEGCDDGNEDDFDACRDGCELAVCGDGVLRTDLSLGDEGYEACDDGNDIDDDACNSACIAAVCGDGVRRSDLNEGVDGYEACDDGNLNDDDACTSACAEARCGDRVVRTDLAEGAEGYEACDDGNIAEEDACTNGCQEARCGDGILRADLQDDDDGFEACDDGNEDNNDACTNDCEVGDPDGDFGGAIALPQDGRGRGVIDPARDVDFYRFEGAAGQWVRITTNANPNDVDTMIDTVVTLYDANRNQIAESDDAVPRRSTDSELITRLAGAGVYYVRVMEFSHWQQGETPEGNADFNYELRVDTLVDNRPSVVVASENGANATVLAMSGVRRFVLGDFESPIDQDNFTVELLDDSPSLGLQIMPVGTTGHGSEQAVTKLEIFDAQDNLLAGIVQSSAIYELSPRLGAGSYRLRLTPVGFRANTNAFYVIKFYRSAGNPPEQSEADNGTLQGAEELSMERRGNGMSGYLAVDLPAGDIDVFSFEAAQGQTLSLACSAAHHGSALRWLQADLLNAQGVRLRRATETLAGMINVRSQALQGAGTYYLSLTSTGRNQTMRYQGARCGVHLNDPAP